jgi:prepilin-type N-terminal cleavage/methylation domain-containing protein
MEHQKLDSSVLFSVFSVSSCSNFDEDRAMKRQGFTLVEMLVAMALTLFIMVILSQAFITGLDSFSQLKAIGDMEETLRVATSNLRNDLTLDHFEGKRRMSDPTFLATLPRQGFFRVVQKTPSWLEGSDLDDPNPPNASVGLDPTVFPPGYPVHVLHFTIKLRGNRRENFLSASVPAGSPLLTTNTNFFLQSTDALYQNNTFNSQWGEVVYFVVATGKTTDAGTNLFNLYRAQFVVAPRNDLINAALVPGIAGTPPSTPPGYTNIACNAYNNSGNPFLYFYTPADLAKQPAAPSSIPPPAGTFVLPRTIDPRSLDPVGDPANGIPPTIVRGGNKIDPRSQATLLTNNVVHFTVQMLTKTAAGVSDTDFNTDQRDYDTAASPGYQVLALQITLRVWDPKTQQSRQISIVQDM